MHVNDDRNLEQVYKSAVAGLYARLRSNYDFIYDKMGDEGLELITEMSHEYGVSVADRARKALKNTDLESVASYLVRIFYTVNWDKRDKIEILEEDGKVIIRAHECPLHFENPALCRAHTAMERAVVEQLNPRLKYNIPRSIPQGDSFCEHVIEIPAIVRRSRSKTPRK